MRTNRSRSRHLIAVTRVAAVLVALAAAVTLTSVAAAGPDGAKQRAISQKGVVVKLAVFANFKAPRALSGPPFTASGTFTALKTTFRGAPGCPRQGQPDIKGCVKLLDKGTVTSTYTFVDDAAGHGAATATGKGGSVTWRFSAPIAPILRSEFPRSVPGDLAPLVGTGKALITDATGDLAQLEGKKGVTAFYFAPVTRKLLLSAHL